MYYYIGTAELVFQQILLLSISLFVNLLVLPMDPDPFLLTLIYFYSPCTGVSGLKNLDLDLYSGHRKSILLFRVGGEL